MSKLKTPRAKKTASLEHDRRNAYGESSKAARKNIPKAKARTERAFRHAVKQALVPVEGEGGAASVVGEKAETTVANAKQKRLQGFHKVPDVPLKVTLGRQKAKREPKRR